MSKNCFKEYLIESISNVNAFESSKVEDATSLIVTLSPSIVTVALDFFNFKKSESLISIEE